MPVQIGKYPNCEAWFGWAGHRVARRHPAALFHFIHGTLGNQEHFASTTLNRLRRDIDPIDLAYNDMACLIAAGFRRKARHSGQSLACQDSCYDECARQGAQSGEPRHECLLSERTGLHVLRQFQVSVDQYSACVGLFSLSVWTERALRSAGRVRWTNTNGGPRYCVNE